jgi:hypothetical protein
VQIKWEGKEYAYSPGEVRVKEGIVIKVHTGLGLLSWERACRDLDPQAIQALLWLIKSRNGEPCEVAMLDFDILAFMTAYGEAMQSLPEPEPAPKADSPSDPTPEPTAT